MAAQGFKLTWPLSGLNLCYGCEGSTLTRLPSWARWVGGQRDTLDQAERPSPGQFDNLERLGLSQQSEGGEAGRHCAHQVKEKPCATQAQVKLHPWVRLGRARETRSRRNPARPKFRSKCIPHGV